MAIFKKNEPSPKPQRPGPPSRAGNGDGPISIIGAGMLIIGDLTTEGIVRIEGEVQGNVRAQKSVILAQSGRVEGNIYTDDAVIGGMVVGSIFAGGRLELQATSSVEGQLRARSEHLKLEEGARFAGEVVMLEEGGLPASGTEPYSTAGGLESTAFSDTRADPAYQRSGSGT